MVCDLYRFICSLLSVLHLVYFVQCVVSHDVYHPFCNITKSSCPGQYPDCVDFGEYKVLLIGFSLSLPTAIFFGLR